MSEHNHKDVYVHRDCPVCYEYAVVSEPGSQVVKWADEAMFTAAPMVNADEPVRPSVTIVSMTYNPLRVMAAACQMYKGDPVGDPDDIPREMALRALEDMKHTALKAPLEYIDLHLLIQGVTRAFTHQIVRQRTAVYSQESMRFAVKENAAMEVAMPPSIADLREDDPKRVIWDNTVRYVSTSYNTLVNAGIPAEDARGLLPTNITTRLHYKTNLRNLAEQAGMRLCSQAQYEWKVVWQEIVRAISHYGPEHERWQQRAIVGLFRPICYQTGQCEFMGSADRYCVIRDRVEAHHRAGDQPDEWHDINPLEPLQYLAARKP